LAEHRNTKEANRGLLTFTQYQRKLEDDPYEKGNELHNEETDMLEFHQVDVKIGYRFMQSSIRGDHSSLCILVLIVFCVCSTPEVSKMHADESIDLRVVAITLAKIGVFCSFCYYCIEFLLYKRMNSKTPKSFFTNL
jgi:hypothetical protein